MAVQFAEGLSPIGAQATGVTGLKINQLLYNLVNGTTGGSAPAGSNFSIPAFNSQAFTYVGSTNNIATIQYKQNGSTVATMTFTYVSGGVSDDDNVASITLT